jgi:hypothetical protein
MYAIMRIRFKLRLILLVICYSGCTPSFAGDDVYLRCEGDISIFKVSGLQIVDRQEIAAHIKDGHISFSGNGLLLGENIPICTPSKDEPYFDSESCHGQSRTGSKRKYGTYNKITGVLHLANEISDNTTAFIEGHFKCAKAVPVMQ